MTDFLTLDSLNVQNKVVLVRADLNVPMENGRVSDPTRITRFAPTARELVQKGAKVVLLSHFGRPKDGPDPEFSLRHLLTELVAALGQPVLFASDCIGPVAENAVSRLKSGEVLLLENVRFHPGEEKNDPEFTAALASLGEIYVNDAFSAAHRAHASTVGLATQLTAAAGRLMQTELEALARVLEKPARPLMAIVGGAKISTKLALLENLVDKVDILAVGGGIAYTFLLAQGHAVGTSIVEPELKARVLSTLAAARTHNCRIVIPEDFVVVSALKSGLGKMTVPATAIPADREGVDIGPLTLAYWEALLEEARTVAWNGPVGAFEFPPFDAGTNALAAAIARQTRARGLVSVIGGGDTVAALEATGMTAEFTYVSTGGGAFLEWLEGKELPGVAALKAAAARGSDQG